MQISHDFDEVALRFGILLLHSILFLDTFVQDFLKLGLFIKSLGKFDFIFLNDAPTSDLFLFIRTHALWEQFEAFICLHCFGRGRRTRTDPETLIAVKHIHELPVKIICHVTHSSLSASRPSIDGSFRTLGAIFTILVSMGSFKTGTSLN